MPPELNLAVAAENRNSGSPSSMRSFWCDGKVHPEIWAVGDDEAIKAERVRLDFRLPPQRMSEGDGFR